MNLAADTGSLQECEIPIPSVSVERSSIAIVTASKLAPYVFYSVNMLAIAEVSAE